MTRDEIIQKCQRLVGFVRCECQTLDARNSWERDINEIRDLALAQLPKPKPRIMKANEINMRMCELLGIELEGQDVKRVQIDLDGGQLPTITVVRILRGERLPEEIAAEFSIVPKGRV
jgi:hypothetical protein